MLDVVKYVLDYFFDFSSGNGNFWHFVALALLCYLISGNKNVIVNNSLSDDGGDNEH